MVLSELFTVLFTELFTVLSPPYSIAGMITMNSSPFIKVLKE